jgi:hypothetical protein
LRKGDFEQLRAATGMSVSAWIRQAVSSHVDYLITKRRKEERLQRKALGASLRDPNL